MPASPPDLPRPARLWPVLIGSVAALVCCGCGGSSGEPVAETPETPVETVETTVQPRMHRWPETIRVQGSLLEDETAVIGAKLPGRVKLVQVDLGSRVKRDEPLVILDKVELELRLKQAQAELRQACAAIGLDPEDSELELDREQAPPVVLERALLEEAQANAVRGRQLLERGATTPAELDRLEAQEKSAHARYESALNRVGEQIATISVKRAAVDLARQELEECEILAPFDGIVVRRQVAPGEYLQAGQAVVTLIRADRLRYTAGVPEQKAVHVRPGQAILIDLPGRTEPVEAKITRMSPSVSQSSRALQIEADVPNPDLLWQAGLFAEAEIVVDPEAMALTVPEGAVTEFAGVEKVLVVKDGESVEQPVRTGRRRDGRIEILSGITTGDLVVTDTPGELPETVLAASEDSGDSATTEAGPEAGVAE